MHECKCPGRHIFLGSDGFGEGVVRLMFLRHRTRCESAETSTGRSDITEDCNGSFTRQPRSAYAAAWRSRPFYDRKRAEGKRQETQAALALARRRVNVLWALVRDSRCYKPPCYSSGLTST